MALDKLVDSTQLDSDLTSVADAIRTKGDTSSVLAFPAGFVSAIGNLPSARLIKYKSVTFTTTATSDARQTVSLEPGMTNYYITVIIDTRPSAPDSSEYIALQWHLLNLTGYGLQQTGMILRPNGTIGTDGAACGFTASTGVLSMGGPYGHFMAGTTYHIYQFEIGAN